MARNINQIFADNPITDVESSDVFYVGRGGVDAAIQGVNLFNASGSDATLNRGTFLATTNQLVLGDTTTTTTTISATAPLLSSVYTIPDVGVSANFVLSAGAQTIGGTKTFSSAVAISPVTNQLVLGTTNTTTINATAPSASSVYTIPDVGVSANFAMTAGSQTIGGAKTFSSGIAVTATSNYFVLSTASQTLTITSATQLVSPRVFTLPYVSADATFVMSEGAQTINGSKTFAANTSVSYSNAGSDVILLVQNGSTSTGSNAYLNLYVNNSGSGNSAYRCGHQSGASQKWTFGFDNDDSDCFVISAGETLGTNNALRINTSSQCSMPNTFTVGATTNQIILGTTNTTTITSPAPAASRVYTIPDAGAAASFMMTAGAQTATGLNTFSAGVQFETSGGTPTTLNYYEEITTTVSLTGPFAGTQTPAMKLTRCGRFVNMWIAAFTVAASSATTILGSAQIPANFRPSADTTFNINILNNSGNTFGSVMIESATGDINIYRSDSGGTFQNFTNAGNLGLTYALSITWVT